MTNYFLALLVEGLGGLFLVLVCCKLYAYRPRRYFLYWMLAWLGFSIWLLLGGVAAHWPEIAPGHPGWQPWLQDLTTVGGWCHAVLWALGTWHFYRSRTAPHSAAGSESVRSLPRCLLRLRQASGPFPRRFFLELGITTLVAVGMSRTLPWMPRAILLATVLTGLYGWSVLLLGLVYRRRQRPYYFGVLMLALLMAVATIACLHYAILHLFQDDLGSLSQFGSSVTYADFLLHILVAVATIIILLEDEQLALSEALGQLADSEARFRLLFEHSGVGMALMTPDGRFVQVNPALERFLGYQDAELYGRFLADLVHPEDRAVSGVVASVQRSDPVLSGHEKRYRRKDGRPVWARALRVLVPDASGAIRYHVGVVVDLDEHKRAEERLREERDFSTQVLETADALIIAVDPEGRIVRFNGKCAEVTGYREEEVRGRVFWTFLVPEAYMDRVRLAFAKVDGGSSDLKRLGVDPERGILSPEMPWRARSGAERLIAWRYTTVRDPLGRLRYVIAAGIDITEQRRLEEQLRHAQKMETLGTLVGGIAHDFNNQLTAIMGNLDLALANLRTSAATAEESSLTPTRDLVTILSDADRAVQRCADMTQRLLTFGRRQVAQVHLLQPNVLVEEVVRLLQRLLPATIRIDTELAAEAWPTKADSTQLHQVLMNLAINARDAMPQGGKLTLSITNRVFDAEQCAHDVQVRAGRFVEIAVRDTGCGMTPEVQERIFEPFFTTKKFGEGTGLGLSMAFGIVQAHGGWMSVQSEPGRGTLFQVYLPAAPEGTRVHATPQEEEPALPHRPRPSASECILLVDDEDLIRSLATVVLEEDGFRVLAACDGVEALDLYRRHGPEIDLVLLDYTMPKMTGLQVLEALQQLDPEVRVVFSSGYAMDTDSDSLIAAGAKGFVAKPYRPADLLRAIREALETEAVVSEAVLLSRARSGVE